MNALATIAVQLVALTQFYAGDVPSYEQPTVTKPAPGMFQAVGVTAAAGRVIPKKMPGWPKWKCAKLQPEGLVCGMASFIDVANVSITYRVKKGMSRTLVIVRKR